MIKDISFSEMLQKSIDKINKKQQDNLRFMQEIKQMQKEKGINDGLKDNQINIMDLLK